ncbi:unnamed protein product, partial [Rotaria sordida]
MLQSTVYMLTVSKRHAVNVQ